MNLYLIPISGKLLIPAESPEDANTIASAIGTSLQIELDKIIPAENRAALSGKISVKKPSELNICERTLERMLQQTEMPLEG